MSDPLKLLLPALAQTCTQSISAIRTAPDTQNIPLSTLRTDFLSLLSLIHSNTTKLSIALNPSSPAYSAAQRPLKDLITNSSTLASNASLFLPDVHGRTLTAEVHSIAKNVLTALEDLARAHLSLITRVPTEAASEEYLSKTGIVHELIAQAKAGHPQGLSRTNLVAVRKRWLEHAETVSDAEAMLEVETFVSDDDDKDSDGWDDPELDLGSDSGEQTAVQKEIAKKIWPVVHHASELLKDIHIALLSPTPSRAQLPPNALLDDLADSAPPFAAAVDNLSDEIFDLPDNPTDFDQSRNNFARALAAVASAVKAFWKGKEDNRPVSHKGSRAYFVDQFAQLNVAVESVEWTHTS
ncbi:hypothetical protein EDB89DRAFT_1919666 [Lactarius sanguifluus]|nr:hypothetical protein EDB89DRAFT_1919666 [Lactarius sanguifluus]